MPYLFVLVLLLVSQFASAEDLNQFSLASQCDWGAKKGLFLVLDNRYDGQPSPLSKMHLTFAVGDGHSWQLHQATDTFVSGRTYTIKAQLDSKEAVLILDGKEVQRFPAGFVPSSAPLFAFDSQDWARRPAEYLVVQHSLTVNSTGQVTRLRNQGMSDARRLVFSHGRSQTQEIKLTVPLTIEAEFEILPYPSLRSLSPLIDRYGQVNFATWPGKVSSDEQLRTALQEEEGKLAEWEKSLPPQDRFGGRTDLGFTDKPTGFFHVIRHEGTWWLISPEGNPCFFIGLDNAPATTWDATPVTNREYLFEWLPPQDGVYQPAWGQDYWGDNHTRYLAPQGANLIAQYGQGWKEKETARSIRRMHAWGFSGMGKWTDLPEQTRLLVLNRGGVPELVHHPDTFDPAIAQQFKEHLRAQVQGQRDDPWVVGFSLGNELDESFSPAEIRQILAKTTSSAAKSAMLSFALEKLFAKDLHNLATAWGGSGESREALSAQKLTPRREDVEPLRAFVAEQYFAFVYHTMKELAPNHLYFGYWILPTYWHNENDWRHMAPYCDVIGFDLYEYNFEGSKIQKMIRESDKPVFCGEFSFPPYFNGDRGYGHFRTATADDADAGKHYAQWIKSAAANPWCVGVSYFQYRDQPVTGRGPVGRSTPAAAHGENYAFGLVDITNRPKYDLVTAVREANVSAGAWHMGRTESR